MQIELRILFTAFFAGIFLSYGQEPKFFQFAHDQFNGTDIYDVVQDNKKNYYFATNQGLFVHDGYSYNKLSCPEMKSLSLFNLRKANDGSIYCYNLKNQVFRIAEGNIELYYEIPKEDQHSYLYLETKDDTAFILSENITKLANDKKVQSYRVPFQESKMRIAFHFLSDGSCVGLSQKQLVELRNGSINKHQIQTDKDSNVIFSAWIQFGGEDYAIDRRSMGVYKFNPSNKKFKFWKYLTKALQNSSIRTYKIKNQIWVIGHQNGAYVYDLNWEPLYGGKCMFQNYFISDVYEDQEGNIMLSTLGEGILVIPDLGMKSIRIPNNEGIISLCFDDQKHYLIATSDGNIYSYNRIAHTISSIYKSPIKKPVDYMAYWKEKNILVFTSPAGFSFAKWNGSSLDSLREFKGSIKDAVFRDSSALLALNTGLFEVKARLEDFEIKAISNEQVRIFSIEEDKINNQVVLNSAEGTFILDNEGSKKELLFNRNKFISTAVKIDGEKLYLGTAFHGILVYKNGVFLQQIMIPETVLDIIPFKDNLYIRCSHEIYIYHLLKKKLSQLTPSLGLDRKAINDYDISESDILLSYSREIDIIPVEFILNNPAVIPVELGELRVNGKRDANRKIAYSTASYVFDFNVATLRHRNNLQYRYKLKGYDNQWQYQDYMNNSVSYRGLPAGDYEFLLQTQNGNTLSEVKSYKFSILAPFYQRLWFYLVVFLAIALVFYVLFRWRLNLAKKKNEELIRQQELKTDLLKMELKALRSQMNPHFIFNSLNSIQHLVLKEDTDNSYDYLVLFAKLVRSTLNYSDLNFITISEELEFLEVYIGLEKLRFKEDFECELTYNGDDEIKVPPLIIQPFIENALVHGLLHKEGNKELSVTLLLKEDHLQCFIQDNGVGREKAKEINARRGNSHQSFAMTAMQQRIELMNKHLNTDVGKFEIIDLYEGVKAIGTRVELHLPVIHSY